MSVQFRYRIFDRVLRSTIALKLPGTEAHAENLSFSYLDDAPAGKETLLHEWFAPSGELTMSVHLIRHGLYAWRLHIPSGGDFYVAADLDQIALVPDPSADTDTVEHLLLDQVVPRVLAQQRETVMHGSCVRLRNGSVLAFVGDTGAGKSTLAQGLMDAGADLLTDDSFLVRVENDQVHLVPGYRALRLWPEVADRYYLKEETRSMAHYSEKRRVLLAPEGETLNRLDALLVLGENSGDIEIDQIQSPAECILLLLSAGFALDPRDSQCHTTWLRTHQALVNSGLKVYRLSYPREFSAMPDVARLIQELA